MRVGRTRINVVVAIEMLAMAFLYLLVNCIVGSVCSTACCFVGVNDSFVPNGNEVSMLSLESKLSLQRRC